MKSKDLATPLPCQKAFNLLNLDLDSFLFSSPEAPSLLIAPLSSSCFSSIFTSFLFSAFFSSAFFASAGVVTAGTFAASAGAGVAAGGARNWSELDLVT